MIRDMFAGTIVIALLFVAGCGTTEVDHDEWFRQVNESQEKLQWETEERSAKASREYLKTIERVDADFERLQREAASVNQMPH